MSWIIVALMLSICLNIAVVIWVSMALTDRMNQIEHDLIWKIRNLEEFNWKRIKEGR